ncbi:MAG: chromosomal replication initiator protein DnaA [Clostridia bacterium]|nr:chromosomal replication initiator protein DnaA [Clostridia bacterium]
MVSDLIKIWTECLILLEEEVTPVGFNTWIKDIKPLNMNDNTLTFSVSTSIIKNMVEMRYYDLIKNTVAQITGKIYNIEFVIGDNYSSQNKKPDYHNTYQKYTFDNFVVGNSNRFAQSASLAVAESPAYAYNPLFLYGGVGLGKTHLMHAIGNYIKAENPDAKIEFLSAETFTNELINSIKDNTNQQFRDKYRNIDVLLVDDIQFIAGKTTTEEEFFHTFNTLHEANKQIVLTSDRPPNEIRTLEERLRSRFGWGLICDIQPPDYETRIAILRKKAQNENIIISDEIIEFIAQKIKSNIRELEGVFNRVIAYRGLINKEITIDVAMEALKDYGESNEKKITPDYIIECCAKFYNVKKEDIYSEKRNKEIAFARQVSIYIIREITNYSFPKIGDIFGKDHATAIYAIKQITKLMEKDISVKINIEGLINDIKGEAN